MILHLSVLAGMSGNEAITLLRQIGSLVKALVYSGYFSDPAMADYRQYGFSEVLREPDRLAD